MSLASRYLKLEVVLYTLLIVACATIAVREFAGTIRFADLLYMNSSLRYEDSFNNSLIDRYASEAQAIIGANECRSDIVQAGLAFTMRDLDLQDSTNRYDDWAKAVQRANDYISFALRCNPGDGDLWVRMAMISQAIGEDPRQLSALMDQSALLAPSELSTLRARFSVWFKASPSALATSSDTVGRDIRTLLNFAQARDIKDIMKDAGPNLAPYVLSAAALVPAQRMALLNARGIGFNANGLVILWK